MKDGEKCILAIGEEGAVFYRLEAESLAGGSTFRYLSGGSLYAPDGCAAGEREPVLWIAPSSFGISEMRYLDRLFVEGEGLFRAELSTGRGASFVSGRAGEEVRLIPPLRGSAASLKLRFLSDRTRVIGITLEFREGRP